MTPGTETYDFSIDMARDDARAGLEISRSSGYAWAERDAFHLLAEISSGMNDVRNRIQYENQAKELDKQLSFKGLSVLKMTADSDRFEE